MKGVVLAGGRGTRLRPFSHATTKHLLPLANRPVIEYIFEEFHRAGITDVGLVVGEPSVDEIRAYVGDGSEFGLDVTYIHQGRPLGLAHAVGCARPFVGDEPFVVYFGDTIVEPGLTARLVEGFDPSVHAGGLSVQEVETPSRFGVVELEDGRISRVHEKPDDPPTNLAYVGVVAFSESVFEYIERLEPSDRGEYELTDTIDAMAAAGESLYHRIENGLWKDVGTPGDLLETNQIMLEDCEQHIDGEVRPGATIEGAVRIGPGSVIESGASVRGPVVIGEDTQIGSDARLDSFTSVGSGCTIDRASVARSLVLDEVTIRVDERLENSILGPGAELTNGHDEERVHSEFVLGPGTSVSK